MYIIDSGSLYNVWIDLLAKVTQEGQVVDGEIKEILDVCIVFRNTEKNEEILNLHSFLRKNTEEMRKVFFSDASNEFGHSYLNKIKGPRWKNDCSDIVELLAREPESKKATLTLIGNGDGNVPCLNVIHFLNRNGKMYVKYFARGQDVYRKFYADAICVYEMAQKVANQLQINLQTITGFISSAHIYCEHENEIKNILKYYPSI